ncbi:hypothetical protein ACOSQ3_004549 [Xanthoceras sorbifolium]
MDGPDLIWIALLNGFIESMKIDESMEISPWIHQIHRASMPETSSFFTEAGEGSAAIEDHRRTDRRITSKNRSKIDRRTTKLAIEDRWRTDRRTTSKNKSKNNEIGFSIDEKPRSF